MQIEGAVALVTGANRGLGRAFARVLLERGARTVYAGARDPASIEDSIDALVPLKLDITDPADVEAAAARCADTTLLINNAVLAQRNAFIGAASLDGIRQEMETNYFGTLSMSRAFAPILGKNGGGALVNMLSIISFFGRPDIGSICATKAALWSLTNSVRIELRPQNTLVVGVHAGFIDTRNAEDFNGPKHSPADIATQVLDAVEANQEEVLADARTRKMKDAIPRDHELIYPEIEAEYLASLA
jgi:NAD(P)-dependent dehydrogenase (short-subunit alcohol dehydrogenase family)